MRKKHHPKKIRGIEVTPLSTHVETALLEEVKAKIIRIQDNATIRGVIEAGMRSYLEKKENEEQ